MKGSQGRNSEQGPGGRNWSRDHGRILPTDFFPMAFSAYYFIYPRTICPWLVLPMVDWVLIIIIIKSLIKKTIRQTCLPTNVMEAFSLFRVPLPRWLSSLCQVTNKLACTPYLAKFMIGIEITSVKGLPVYTQLKVAVLWMLIPLLYSIQ